MRIGQRGIGTSIQPTQYAAGMGETVTYLDRIVAAHRAAAERDDRPLERLAERAMLEAPARGFRRALAAADGLGVIAEVKRRSPSKGDLFGDLVAGELAKSYEAGGGTCLSVLTDQAFFGGSHGDLVQARHAVAIPVLRKDFTVSTHDVFDARIMGADCILLIVAALDDDELRRFHRLASDLGLDCLVEIHDEAELERAMRVEPSLIGVNQRDLVTFEVDQQRAARMAPLIPDSIVKVAESGVSGPADAGAARDAGYDAVLVGEALVRSGDPEAAVRALRRA